VTGSQFGGPNTEISTGNLLRNRGDRAGEPSREKPRPGFPAWIRLSTYAEAAAATLALTLDDLPATRRLGSRAKTDLPGPLSVRASNLEFHDLAPAGRAGNLAMGANPVKRGIEAAIPAGKSPSESLPPCSDRHRRP
jgi:hypothetical protein